MFVDLKDMYPTRMCILTQGISRLRRGSLLTLVAKFNNLGRGPSCTSGNALETYEDNSNHSRVAAHCPSTKNKWFRNVVQLSCPPPTNSILQGRFSKAESLFKRSSTIHERMLISEHPIVASSHSNLATLLMEQVRTAAIRCFP